MKGRPRRSPLFPSPTLFRFVLRRIEHLEQRRRRVAPPVAPDLVDLVEHDHGVAGASLLEGARDASGQRADIGATVTTDLDRKSTRLNSSHSQISYAVFCLKK